MYEFLRHLIPLVLSANTLAMTWYVGKYSVTGWVLGVSGQVLWFAFIFMYQAWGLLPMAVALTGMYAWNLRKWLREQRVEEAKTDQV